MIDVEPSVKQRLPLHGASAFDLSRRDVVHFKGDAGAIAKTSAQVIRQNGRKFVIRRKS
jgi:hypothetical protein